jgi:hypothetical protein
MSSYALNAENILNAMRNYLGDDERRKNHAEAVFDYACTIQKQEGGDICVVMAAAALHDIGIHEAERKYNSAAGNYQEIEGPPIARDILKKFDVNSEQIEHICKIIANHHSARDIDTVEFRAIWDADWLVNIPDEFDLNDKDKINKLINRNIKTDTGKKLSQKFFI